MLINSSAEQLILGGNTKIGPPRRAKAQSETMSKIIGVPSRQRQDEDAPKKPKAQRSDETQNKSKGKAKAQDQDHPMDSPSPKCKFYLSY